MLGFDRLRGKTLNWAMTLSAGICFLCFGYDQGVFGGILGAPSFIDAMNNPSANTLSNLTAVYPLGCMLGCFIAIGFGLKLGRRRSILCGCTLITIGGALQASATTHAQIYVGRVVAGTGTGMTSSAIPIWLSESARKATRGRDISVQLCIVTLGTVTAYWFDYGTLNNYTSSLSWRLPIAFQCVFSVTGGLLVFMLPESPRLLYKWQRGADADVVLARLLDCPIDSPQLIEQRQIILDNMAMEDRTEEDQPLWRSILWDKTPLNNSRRFWIVVTMQMLQEMGGINVAGYYETVILHDSIGLDAHTSSLLAGASATVLFIGAVPGIYIIEAWGRRTSLLVGALGTTCSMLGFTVALSQVTGNQAAGWAAYAFLCLFEFFFAIAWLGVVWAYAPEISPLKFRHINASAAVCSEWLFTFVTVKMAPVGIQNLGWRIYIIFLVFNFLQMPFVYFFVPETKNKTLEEIDIMFSKFGSKEAALEAAHVAPTSVDGKGFTDGQYVEDTKAERTT